MRVCVDGNALVVMSLALLFYFELRLLCVVMCADQNTLMLQEMAKMREDMRLMQANMNELRAAMQAQAEKDKNELREEAERNKNELRLMHSKADKLGEEIQALELKTDHDLASLRGSFRHWVTSKCVTCVV